MPRHCPTGSAVRWRASGRRRTIWWTSPRGRLTDKGPEGPQRFPPFEEMERAGGGRRMATIWEAKVDQYKAGLLAQGRGRTVSSEHCAGWRRGVSGDDDARAAPPVVAPGARGRARPSGRLAGRLRDGRGSDSTASRDWPRTARPPGAENGDTRSARPRTTASSATCTPWRSEETSIRVGSS